MKQIIILWDFDQFECIVNIPDEMDLEAERQEWYKWYHEEYCRKGKPGRIKYHSLLDQLLKHGCKKVKMEIFSI